MSCQACIFQGASSALLLVALEVEWYRVVGRELQSAGSVRRVHRQVLHVENEAGALGVYQPPISHMLPPYALPDR